MRIIVIIFLAIGFLQTGITAANSTLDKSIRQGNKLLSEKKFDQALPIWLDIVENNPVNYSACFKLGLCYYFTEKKQANAIPYFKKALSNTTKDYKFYNTKEKRAPVDAYYYLAETYLMMEIPDSAMKYFIKYQNIYDGNPPINVYPKITSCLSIISAELAMEKEEEKLEDQELEVIEVPDNIQMVNDMGLEEAIEVIEGEEINSATEIIEGIEIEKATAIMANVEVEKAIDIFNEVEVEKAIDIIEEFPVEKAIEVVENMEVEKAVDVMEGMEVEKAVIIAENMPVEKTIDLFGYMEIEKAVNIAENMETEKVVEIIEGVEVEKAGDIISGLSDTKADLVVNELKQKMEEGISDNAIAIIKRYFSDQIEKKESIIFKRVYFDLNSSELLMLTKKELLLLIDFLNENKLIKIEVVGHTDITGSWDHNLVLSNNRAKEVYKFLLDHEVSPQRIIHYGKGSAQPIASNDTEEGRNINRRVEVILLQ